MGDGHVDVGDVRGGVVLPATYLLPIRSPRRPSAELTGYLRDLSAHLPVVIVDGSDPDVFEDAHRRWSPFAVHVAPDPRRRCANGKVHGVLTGLALVDRPAVVIADDDVRYTPDTLRTCLDALATADLVCPQNYFWPLPWHARWDSGRILLNRMLGGDLPGTVVARSAAVVSGYDGDVLFENLELIRTVEARGGRAVDRPDVYVRRLPPDTGHFVGQRVRQAYDELARPTHLVAQLAVVPVVVATLVGHRRMLAAGAIAAVAAAEAGRRRWSGRRYFPRSAALWAPVWLVERGLCSWGALWLRGRGGVVYGERRLKVAAHSRRALRARHR